MFYYLIRRIAYGFLILLSVNLITFTLFFIISSPDHIAKAQLGDKHITQKDIDAWKAQKGYDKPLFLNLHATGFKQWTDTLFFQESLKLFMLDFGHADSGRNITQDITERMGPSLAFAVPQLLLGTLTYTCIALLLILFSNTLFERLALIVLITMLSISYLFYIIAGQYFIAKNWQWVPISGYLHEEPWRFLVLPIMIGVISGLGQGVRLYRSFFIEAAQQAYTQAARAKGLSELRLLFVHILPNALIPILTNVVAVIPLLFLGALIMESFFGIPGLGSYLLEAIRGQDFAIVRAIVFLGAFLYIIGLILTDISYTLADPRVRLS